MDATIHTSVHSKTSVTCYEVVDCLVQQQTAQHNFWVKEDGTTQKTWQGELTANIHGIVSNAVTITGIL